MSRPGLSLAGALRAAGRALLLGLVWPGTYLPFKVVGMLPFLSASRRTAWQDRLALGWARGTARVLGLSVEVRGRVPAPPFLLVSNHLSYLDVVVYMSLVRGYFVAKSEVASWPVLGWLAAGTGTLFVDRDNPRDAVRVGGLIRDAVEAGRGIILFPEGTSTDGSRVEPFKAALLRPAADDVLPVHCASLRYAVDHPGHEVETSVCWWGDMTFTGHFVRLLSIPTIRARVTFDEEPVREGDRRRLAEILHTRVSHLAMDTPQAEPLR